MKFIRGIYNIQSEHLGCVATIGNFDGVHLGHQCVLQNLKQQAKQLNLPSLVITFEPLALEFFQPEKAPARLMRLREKLETLREYGVDRVLCLRFNKSFANSSAKDFVKKILVEKLGIKYLIVGDDFHFGKNRLGDFHLLQCLGQENHFQVAATDTVLYDNIRVGSSRIRAALSSGDLQMAQKLLGRPYMISGHVAAGDQRGRQLGFPTANIPLRRLVTPLSGVFAVKVHGINEQALPAVVNIGNRPTMDGKKYLLEVHVINFSADIYRKFIKIEFIEKIRDEKKFNSLEELKLQIANDKKMAERILKNQFN